MASRYTIRPTSRGPMDWLWAVLAVLAVIAGLTAISDTLAAVVVAAALLWWLALRAARAWARTREP